MTQHSGHLPPSPTMSPPGPALLGVLLLLLRTASAQNVTILNAPVGGRVQMAPVFRGDPQGFEWKKGPNKIIEVDFPDDFQHYVLKDRSELNLTTGVLTISNLQLSDSGSYTVDVLVNGRYQKTAFQLHVFPALNKPTVTCSDTNTGFLLRCHHDPDPPTYEWYNGGKPVSDIPHKYHLTDQNRSLTVGHMDRESLKSLECVVKNPATENRTSAPETCNKKDYTANGRSGLIAALVIVLLIVVIIWGFCGPEESFLRRLFNPLRTRIRGFIEHISNRFRGYRATATNEPDADHNSTRRQSDGSGGERTQSASEDHLPKPKTDPNKRDGSGDEGNESATKSLLPQSETHQKKRDGSGGERTQSASEDPLLKPKTDPNKRELPKDSQNHPAEVPDPPSQPAKDSQNHPAEVPDPPSQPAENSQNHHAELPDPLSQPAKDLQNHHAELPDPPSQPDKQSQKPHVEAPDPPSQPAKQSQNTPVEAPDPPSQPAKQSQKPHAEAPDPPSQPAKQSQNTPVEAPDPPSQPAKQSQKPHAEAPDPPSRPAKQSQNTPVEAPDPPSQPAKQSQNTPVEAPDPPSQPAKQSQNTPVEVPDSPSQPSEESQKSEES